MAVNGACLCGQVSYEIDQLDMPVEHCHCKTCRKAHASAYTTTAGVLRGHFRINRGAELLRAFESSPGKLRKFCSNCGTHLFAERPDQPHIILRVATLDENPGKNPEFHIWTSHDVQWLAPECPSYLEWQPR